MIPQANMIECTAGQASSELTRCGVLPQERVTITVFQEPELIPGQRETRARVVAAGLSDEDINRLIKEVRTEVNEEMRREKGISS